MVVVVGVTEERAELATVALNAASGADLERGGVKINADFVFRPVPLIAKAFDLIEVARDNMGDLAGWQFAFIVAKGAQVNRAFGAAKQFGQKIVADGHYDAALSW